MTQASFISLLILSSLIFIGAFIGGAIPLIRRWKEGHLHHFISFGAGVLMGAAFLHMIPEATVLIQEQVGIAVLSGFLIFYFLEKFIMIHPCYEGSCEYHHLGMAAFIGFSFHNVTDGVALGGSFFVPALTPYVFLALISHHIPTSFAFTSILKVSRYSVKKILVMLLFFSLMVPIGAFSSHLMLMKWSSLAAGWVVALSAGTFIHIAICDLLPAVHKSEENKWGKIGYFVVGLGIMVLLSVVFNHHH